LTMINNGVLDRVEGVIAIGKVFYLCVEICWYYKIFV
jgi:hypothetical protein